MTENCTHKNCNHIPCPECKQPMHLCYGCNEYHCYNSNCKNFVG